MMIMSVYNPAYGLPDDMRYQALVDAEEHGIYAAAKMHGLAMSTVYRWRKQMIMKPAKETAK
ncbi:hypothetical protein UFOVP1202_46 [uncultured Caudovirales phage]|uniref:Homeodomain-like domain containing protein n=1 Tax=uncultured Caudovirales phage TaxID=2100421 RepID=A0A6J5RFA6_9CAUD|nr:hypothetical protein UFOVP1202_46 [uncultured Caudovirales phage]